MDTITELERILSLYFIGRLPDDVMVYFRKQASYGYPEEELQWIPVMPENDWHDTSQDSEATLETEYIPIRTILTPFGKLRAGYGDKTKTLIVIQVVDMDGYLNPAADGVLP